jgi:hypothetical protein
MLEERSTSGGPARGDLVRFVQGRSSYPYHPSLEIELPKWPQLQREDCIKIFAVLQNVVIGFVVGRRTEYSNHIDSLVVGAPFRRTGLGRRLFAEFAGSFADMSKKFALDAVTDSVPFWESLGFRVTPTSIQVFSNATYMVRLPRT